MNLYALTLNGQNVCNVTVETPAWLPVRPRVPKTWLASLVGRVLRRCFTSGPRI